MRPLNGRMGSLDDGPGAAGGAGKKHVMSGKCVVVLDANAPELAPGMFQHGR